MNTFQLFFLLFSLSICIGATAKSKLPFQGYKRSTASTVLVYEGRIQSYFEENSNFFILIENYSGLYRFPKQALENQRDFSQFLDQSIKNQVKLKFEINAENAQIISINR